MGAASAWLMNPSLAAADPVDHVPGPPHAPGHAQGLAQGQGEVEGQGSLVSIVFCFLFFYQYFGVLVSLVTFGLLN